MEFDPYNLGYEDGGTTLIALECTDGIVIGADSRTSAGSTIACRNSDKITQIAPQVFVARTGSTADTQELARYAKQYLNVLNTSSPNEEGKKYVRTAANCLGNLVRNNRKMLSAGFLCCGYDKAEGFQVFDVNISGSVLRRKIASNGSGSAYLGGYCDETYREDFNVEEGTKFVINSVTSAIIRDGSSGGLINIVQIKTDGVKRFWIKPKDYPFDDTIVKT